MYESPIQITELADNIFKQISDAKEAYIMAEVKMVVDVDKGELIRALQYDRDQYYKGYADRDNEIIRCIDCKHRPIATEGKAYGKYLEFPDEDVCPCNVGDPWYSWMPEDDFFCGKGERREE